MCHVRWDFVVGICEKCERYSARRYSQKVCFSYVEASDYGRDQDHMPIECKQPRMGLVPKRQADSCDYQQIFTTQPPLEYREPMFVVRSIQSFDNPEQWEKGKECIRCDTVYGESNWYQFTQVVPLFYMGNSIQQLLEDIPAPFDSSIPGAKDQERPHITPDDQDYKAVNVGSYIRLKVTEKAKKERAAKEAETKEAKAKKGEAKGAEAKAGT